VEAVQVAERTRPGFLREILGVKAAAGTALEEAQEARGMPRHELLEAGGAAGGGPLHEPPVGRPGLRFRRRRRLTWLDVVHHGLS